MIGLRLHKSQVAYEYARDNGLLVNLWDKPVIKKFKHFKIVSNDYPHDKIADVHHLLIPIRKVDSWEKLHWWELREARKINQYLERHYDCISLNLPSVNSI